MVHLKSASVVHHGVSLTTAPHTSFCSTHNQLSVSDFNKWVKLNGWYAVTLVLCVYIVRKAKSKMITCMLHSQDSRLGSLKRERHCLCRNHSDVSTGWKQPPCWRTEPGRPCSGLFTLRAIPDSTCMGIHTHIHTHTLKYALKFKPSLALFTNR